MKSNTMSSAGQSNVAYLPTAHLPKVVNPVLRGRKPGVLSFRGAMARRLGGSQSADGVADRGSELSRWKELEKMALSGPLAEVFTMLKAARRRAWAAENEASDCYYAAVELYESLVGSSPVVCAGVQK